MKRVPPTLKHPGRLIVLVTGGRDFTDEYRLDDMLDQLLQHCEGNQLQMIVVEGGARGADRIARMWAYHNGVQVVTERAQWRVHGDRAGPIRNQLMIDKYQPDVCIAMPRNDGTVGNGTADTVRRCKLANIPVLE